MGVRRVGWGSPWCAVPGGVPLALPVGPCPCRAQSIHVAFAERKVYCTLEPGLLDRLALVNHAERVFLTLFRCLC